jgi:L-ascorbate metabolism protein UlaG (beta-lactamase superfamily)
MPQSQGKFSASRPIRSVKPLEKLHFIGSRTFSRSVGGQIRRRGSIRGCATHITARCFHLFPPIVIPPVPVTRRKILGWLAGFGAAAVVPSAWMYRMKTYDGPVSDHFDGLHFFDPDGSPPKPLREVLRWQFGGGRHRATWPDRAPSGFADTPPPRVDGNKVRLSFVGHASWLIQTSGLNILVDPVWSERVSPFSFVGPKRHNDPGIAFDALPGIDVVLVSHGHYDHLDLATLSKLQAKCAPRIVTPLGNDITMRSADAAIKAEGFDWHDRVELGNELAVTLVPTRHWSARGLYDRNKALWASFVLQTPAGKLYIVCDSGYGEGKHFRRVAEAHGPLRLAILPIGAYEPRWFMKDQHMNPSDAVMALADCGAQQALAHHHGTFQLTDEAIDAPATALGVALDEAKIPRERFVALKPGQVFEI